MSNVLDKSFIHRSYPKLAYGSIYLFIYLSRKKQINLQMFENDPSTGPLNY